MKAFIGVVVGCALLSFAYVQLLPPVKAQTAQRYHFQQVDSISDTLMAGTLKDADTGRCFVVVALHAPYKGGVTIGPETKCR